LGALVVALAVDEEKQEEELYEHPTVVPATTPWL